MSAPPPLARPLLEHRDAIARLCHSFGVQKLEVFGSAADGRFDPARSDIDLIVTFDREVQGSIADRYFGLADALEQLLGARVDLLTSQPIRNPYFRDAVEASRRELYVRAPAEASMRNRITHGYDTVDNGIVYETVTTRFAPLVEGLQRELEQVNRGAAPKGAG